MIWSALCASMPGNPARSSREALLISTVCFELSPSFHSLSKGLSIAFQRGGVLGGLLPNLIGRLIRVASRKSSENRNYAGKIEHSSAHGIPMRSEH
jgi:hypothetical protein